MLLADCCALWSGHARAGAGCRVPLLKVSQRDACVSELQGPVWEFHGAVGLACGLWRGLLEGVALRVLALA